MSWVDFIKVFRPLADQPRVRVRYTQGAASSTQGEGDKLLLTWKGTLELYNSEPADAFDLRLELKPGCTVQVDELQHTHLRSGEAVELHVLVSRQFDRDVVVPCHDRFRELLPDDLRRLSCRVAYRNRWKIPFYTLYGRADEADESTYHRRRPKWPAA